MFGIAPKDGHRLHPKGLLSNAKARLLQKLFTVLATGLYHHLQVLLVMFTTRPMLVKKRLLQPSPPIFLRIVSLVRSHPLEPFLILSHRSLAHESNLPLQLWNMLLHHKGQDPFAIPTPPPPVEFEPTRALQNLSVPSLAWPRWEPQVTCRLSACL